jgi:hypothetical protein
METEDSEANQNWMSRFFARNYVVIRKKQSQVLVQGAMYYAHLYISIN